ncbi:MAG: hypothetical protein AB1611_06095 [bacterium]
MAETVSMKIPKNGSMGIPDEPAIMRQIISLGIRQYKMIRL